MAEYNRKQSNKTQVGFAHKQVLTQNVKRARGEILVHVFGQS